MFVREEGKPVADAFRNARCFAEQCLWVCFVFLRFLMVPGAVGSLGGVVNGGGVAAYMANSPLWFVLSQKNTLRVPIQGKELAAEVAESAEGY